MPTDEVLQQKLQEAEAKAWDALARYKFWMFGYFAARWVFLSQVLKEAGKVKQPNPFKALVKYARHQVKPSISNSSLTEEGHIEEISGLPFEPEEHGR